MPGGGGFAFGFAFGLPLPFALELSTEKGRESSGLTCLHDVLWTSLADVQVLAESHVGVWSKIWIDPEFWCLLDEVALCKLSCCC